MKIYTLNTKLFCNKNNSNLKTFKYKLNKITSFNINILHNKFKV